MKKFRCYKIPPSEQEKKCPGKPLRAKLLFPLLLCKRYCGHYLGILCHPFVQDQGRHWYSGGQTPFPLSCWLQGSYLFCHNHDTHTLRPIHHLCQCFENEGPWCEPGAPLTREQGNVNSRCTAYSAARRCREVRSTENTLFPKAWLSLLFFKRLRHHETVVGSKSAKCAVAVGNTSDSYLMLCAFGTLLTSRL